MFILKNNALGCFSEENEIKYIKSAKHITCHKSEKQHVLIELVA